MDDKIVRFVIEQSVNLVEGENSAYDRFRFCFKRYEIPTTFKNCSFQRSNFESAFFKDHRFIGCDFSHSEAANAIFQDCEFKDCVFKQVNFVNSSFIGCKFIEENNISNNFTRSSFYKAKFIKSDKNPTYLIDLHLNGFGLRNSVWKDCIFLNLRMNDVSFEDAIFSNCKIDFMDLSNCSCRGIEFNNCQIEEFNSTLEKVASTIGVENILKKSDFLLKTYGLDKSKPFRKINSTLRDYLFRLLDVFFKECKLFEVLNIKKIIIELFPNQKLLVEKQLEATEKSYYKSIQFYHLDENKIIELLFNVSNNQGSFISFESISKTFRFLEYHNIYDIEIFYQIKNILLANTITEEILGEIHPLTKSVVYYQVIQYLTKINLHTKLLIVKNPDIYILKSKDLEEFSEFIEELLNIAKIEISEYKIINIKNNSVEFEISLKLTGNLLELLFILSSLGISIYQRKKIVGVLKLTNKTLKDYSSKAISKLEGLKLFLDEPEKNVNSFFINEISKRPNIFNKINDYLKKYKKISISLEPEKVDINHMLINNIEFLDSKSNYNDNSLIN